MPLPWLDSPVIDIDLDRPVAQRYDGIPEPVRQAGRELMVALRAEATGVPPALAEVVRARTMGRFQPEARALAAILGARPQEIMLANCTYDLVMNFIFCSAAAVEGPGGPALARNMDFWPEAQLARASCLLRYMRGGQPAWWIAGWPGSIGVVSGMSARGFALALNAVSCTERPPPTGYPVMLHLRRVLEDARDYDHALEMIATQKLAAPCMVMLVGTRNDQRVVIERTPTRHALRRTEPGEALIATNEYRLMQDAGASANELTGTACGRFEALSGFFAGAPASQRGLATDEALLYVLSEPDVQMAITAQQMIFRPASGDVRLVAPRRFFE